MCPANEREMGYNVRTTFCDGSWWAAAERYRTWHNKQFWCETRLEDR